MFTHFLCHPNQASKKGIYPFTLLLSTFSLPCPSCLSFLSHCTYVCVFCRVPYSTFSDLLSYSSLQETRDELKAKQRQKQRESRMQRKYCVSRWENRVVDNELQRETLSLIPMRPSIKMEKLRACDKNWRYSKKKKWQEVCWGTSLFVRRQEATWEQTWQRKRAEGNTKIHLKHRITCDARGREKERERKKERETSKKEWGNLSHAV